MAARHVSLELLVLSLSALGQQSRKPDAYQPESLAERGTDFASGRASCARRPARLAALHQDASELSVLSISVQSDLQKLQRGMLVKNLDENLKKMEKLSKKVRREIE
jgi:hypothetical protein